MNKFIRALKKGAKKHWVKILLVSVALALIIVHTKVGRQVTGTWTGTGSWSGKSTYPQVSLSLIFNWTAPASPPCDVLPNRVFTYAFSSNEVEAGIDLISKFQTSSQLNLRSCYELGIVPTKTFSLQVNGLPVGWPNPIYYESRIVGSVTLPENVTYIKGSLSKTCIDDVNSCLWDYRYCVTPPIQGWCGCNRTCTATATITEYTPKPTSPPPPTPSVTPSPTPTYPLCTDVNFNGCGTCKMANGSLNISGTCKYQGYTCNNCPTSTPSPTPSLSPTPTNGGTIMVGSNVPDAPFILKKDNVVVSESTTGSTSNVSAVFTAGSYTITWGGITDYVLPNPETKVLAQGETIVFTGNYSSIPTISDTSAPTNTYATSETPSITPEDTSFKGYRGLSDLMEDYLARAISDPIWIVVIIVSILIIILIIRRKGGK